MNINYEKLKTVIEFYAVPKWKTGGTIKWPWRPGGGEVYIQEKVLKNAAPNLTQDSIRRNPKGAITGAIKANYNLLSQYESMFALTFVESVSENELREQTLDLLYGTEPIETRLRKFLEWSKVEPIPDKNMKKGLNATACSYLLAVSNSKEYAYCKPSAYRTAATELLGALTVPRNAVDRIIHCTEFYKEILEFLEREYQLKDGNLFDVHSMFYCFQEDDENGTVWDKIKVSVPKPRPGPDVSPPPDNEIYNLLMGKHNVVLYGPPGTGKTRQALLFGNTWRNTYGPDTVRQLTFHPTYCYEDFIEGYRPNPNGSNFELREGIFKALCREAKSNPEKKYLLIVDEINRGDLARILGELITLIEGDKRGEKYTTLLQQSQETFFVPENLYLLGTMNTADKSISLIDLAIRRRFLFYFCPPDPDVLNEGKKYCDSINECRLSKLLINLNNKLMNVGVDRDRMIGHSYLLVSKESTDPLNDLRNRFKYEIIPLVEEYCYADRSLLGRVLGDLVDQNGLINSDVMDDNERFSDTLKKLSDAE